MRTLLTDFPHLGEAPDLKTAGIREDGPPPMHEAMQPLMRCDDLQAGPEVQVKSVAEHDLGAYALEILRSHGLDRAIRADRHERRRLDGAAGKLEPAAPRRAVLRQQLEAHRAQLRTMPRFGIHHALSGVDAASADAQGVRNIASP